MSISTQSKSILVDAILFDLDGTLIDSTPGVIKAWEVFANDYSLDAAEVAHATHGRRLYDTLKEWCHIDDEETLQSEIGRFEEAVIQGGPVVLPGAQELLTQVGGIPDANMYLPDLTYAGPSLLPRCEIPLPSVGVVTSDDVQRGKPHPDPYLAGAKKCNVDPANCLVVEDAPSGLLAGRAAGAKTLAVCTSHTRQAIQDSGAGPDFIVNDLTKVRIHSLDGKVVVKIDES